MKTIIILLAGALMLASFQPAVVEVAATPTMSDSIGSDPIVNYPDPFCGVTTIEYELTEASWVSLIVTCPNLTVDILVFGYQDAGIHKVVYDACSKPCGSYIATLETEYLREYEVMIRISSDRLPFPPGSD